MGVTYTLTEQDYVRGLEASIRSGRKLFSLPNLLVWAVTAAILIGLTGQVLELAGMVQDLGWGGMGILVALPLIAVYAGAAAALVLVYHLVRRPSAAARRRFSSMKSRQAFAPGFFGEQVLELGEQSVKLSFAGEEREFRCGGLSFREAAGYLFLLSGDGLITVLPPEAFPDETARRAFTAGLSAAIAAAPGADPASDPLWVEARAQADVALSYSWETEDFVTALCREVRALFFTRWYWLPMGLRQLVTGLVECVAGLWAMPMLAPGAAGIVAGLVFLCLGLVMLWAVLSPILPGYRAWTRAGLKDQAGPQLLCFTGREIQIHRRRSDSVLAWRDVVGLREREGTVFLLTRGRKLLPIPPSAFADAGERERVLAYLRGHLGQK